jgi:hypothetical protein
MNINVTKGLTALFLPLMAATAPLATAQTNVQTNGNPYIVATVGSTVAPNGDLNPYGVAVVPRSIGNLVAGHILVSNFNNSKNQQGTGTTIMDFAPDGQSKLFAQINPAALPGQCPGGVGLTTALVVLQAGWVVVGSLPTTDGTPATAQAGCLLVLDNQGVVVETISNLLINGPWDMTALDLLTTANLFITNVLNGTVAANGQVVHEGTVVRIDLTLSASKMPSVQSTTMIGSGIAERTDPAALVIGPTGAVLAADGSLYVADTLENRIIAIPNAVNRSSSDGNGTNLSNVAVLNNPLGLAIRPDNGDILVTNGNNGMLVVLNSAGNMKYTGFLDKQGTPPGAGTLFGLATSTNGLYFVDDGSNMLKLLTNPL